MCRGQTAFGFGQSEYGWWEQHACKLARQGLGLLGGGVVWCVVSGLKSCGAVGMALPMCK